MWDSEETWEVWVAVALRALLISLVCMLLPFGIMMITDLLEGPSPPPPAIFRSLLSLQQPSGVIAVHPPSGRPALLPTVSLPVPRAPAQHPEQQP